MKQIITDGKLVREINENAQEPITVGRGVSDELEISIGQILEDDLTVRDITEEEIIDRFGLQTSVNKKHLYTTLTKEEIHSFISASKTNINIEIIKEILDAGGAIDLIQETILVDENIITAERKEDILGITEKKEFIANGMVIGAEETVIDVFDPVQEEEDVVSEEQADTTDPAAE
jgi:hypothetical protein